MSEKLRITCLCGYENWVAPDLLGQSVECAMCGATLTVDEAAVSGHFESPDAAGYNDETSAPESPTSPPHRAATPPDGPTLEERVEAQRKKRGRPLSPFDADEEEEEPPRRADSAPRNVAAPPQPRPRARSPFEADEPKPEEKARGGPFTLERQDRAESHSAALEEHRPKERRDRHVVVETISPHDAPSGEKCSECGRLLRGSWDRVETESGVICYVCSNQAVTGMPARRPAPVPKGNELREIDLIDRPPANVPVEYEPWYKDPESLEFRRVLWSLAFLTLALGAYFMFFEDSAAPVIRNAVELQQQKIEATPVTKVVFQAWRIFAGFASLSVALFLTLWAQDGLPQRSFLANLLYIAALCIPIAAVNYLIGILVGVAATIPVVGGIIVAVSMLRWWLFFVILGWFVSLRFSDVLIVLVVYMGIRILVFGFIGSRIFSAYSF